MTEDLDALLARLEREEQDDADRDAGQGIVDAIAQQEDRRKQEDAALLAILRQAQQSEVDASEAKE